MTRPVPLVLNIDDDEAGRYVVNRALRQAGFEVLDADTGLKGLAAARAHLPDIILLDIRLPDIDGFEVCRRIREDPQLQHIGVIHMSASYLDTSSKVRGLDTGADAYLTEPVEPSILVATTKSLLRFKKAEVQVRESAQEWQTTFDALSEGIALLDLDDSVRRSNAAFLKIAGGRDSEQRKAISRLLQALKETGDPQRDESLIADTCFTIGLDPVSGAGGELSGAVCVVVDITEKRRFEQQLQQTARLESLGVLAGGIAHDFNNLLTGILGNSTLMLETIARDAPEREMLSVVVEASESAANLTRQILTYAGKGIYELAPVDLSTVARQSLTFARRIVSKKVQFVDEIAEGIPLVEADATQMQQLMMNLIINATESFGETGSGTVRVSTRVETLTAEFFAHGEANEPGDYVSFVVEDDGCGMDQATQNRIFEPFFTTKFTGRGLGLSTVHGIVRKHKALLRLWSSVGAGTRFSLYFKQSPSTRPKSAPAKAIAPSACEGTILVVDDEASVRGVARVALERKGYGALFAENGREGVDLFRKHHRSISLVLMDFMMPVMGGEEAIREMRVIAPEVPILVSSGYSLNVTLDRLGRENVAGFLVKPFTTSQLTDAIATALKHSDAVAQNSGSVGL